MSKLRHLAQNLAARFQSFSATTQPHEAPASPKTLLLPTFIRRHCRPPTQGSIYVFPTQPQGHARVGELPPCRKGVFEQQV